ncbi:MAG: nucleotide exchange factor GrpE [Clostridiales Family XIII bacterium]|jgi:molecular chaperone GrpE|nr:nucleotide exchange factor GrpE [Clostridiales Family XIII bacterium]
MSDKRSGTKKTPEKEPKQQAAGKPAKEQERRTEQDAENEIPKDEPGVGAEDQSAESAPEAESSETGESADARYMRLAADFQNYKKRTEKERSDVYVYANAKFAGDLLEVLDNFERAIDRDATEGADEKFLEGMDMIRVQLTNVLKKNDVEEITAVGEVFDPNFHHAVVMEVSDEYESGHVTYVMQKGYKLKDKVIRPAMVKVAE